MENLEFNLDETKPDEWRIIQDKAFLAGMIFSHKSIEDKKMHIIFDNKLNKANFEMWLETNYPSISGMFVIMCVERKR